MAWITRWRYLIWDKPVKPNIWRLKQGGYLARCRVKDPKSDKLRDFKDTHADVDAAQAWQVQKRREIREGQKTQSGKIRFYDYAVSLLERKTQTGKIKSAASIEVWANKLHHLGHFHDLYMGSITRADIKDWLTRQGGLVKRGEYQDLFEEILPVELDFYL